MDRLIASVLQAGRSPQEKRAEMLRAERGSGQRRRHAASNRVVLVKIGHFVCHRAVPTNFRQTRSGSPIWKPQRWRTLGFHILDAAHRQRDLQAAKLHGAVSHTSAGIGWATRARKP